MNELEKEAMMAIIRISASLEKIDEHLAEMIKLEHQARARAVRGIK